MEGNANGIPRRVRVEQGMYHQPNGKYAVCFMVEGKPRFRRSAMTWMPPASSAPAYIDATRWGIVPASPRLRFARVAGWWVERYARGSKPASGVERTLDATATPQRAPPADPSARA